MLPDLSGLRPPPVVDPDLPVPDRDHPRAGVRVGRRRALHAVAALQHGLFTTAQAARAGLDRRARYHHLTYGNWRRTEAPGIFRLAGWPPDPHERLRAWLLWGGPDAAITGWYCLEAHRLTVAGPRCTIDLSLPRARTYDGHRRDLAARRRLSAVLEGRPGAPKVLPSPASNGPPVRLHRRRPSASSVDTADGLRLRPPEDAICDLVSEGSSTELVLSLMDELVRLGRLDALAMIAAATEGSHLRVRDHLFVRLREGSSRELTPSGADGRSPDA